MNSTGGSPFVTGWGACTDCGYEGVLEYFKVEGEYYDDPDALGVMLLLRCPACGSRDHSLVSITYFRELISGQEEPSGQ